jgi:hypothetical protein
VQVRFINSTSGYNYNVLVRFLSQNSDCDVRPTAGPYTTIPASNYNPATSAGAIVGYVAAGIVGFVIALIVISCIGGVRIRKIPAKNKPTFRFFGYSLVVVTNGENGVTSVSGTTYPGHSTDGGDHGGGYSGSDSGYSGGDGGGYSGGDSGYSGANGGGDGGDSGGGGGGGDTGGGAD